MLELRLYHTKRSIEQELEKDYIDGLSSPLLHSPAAYKSSVSSNGVSATPPLPNGKEKSTHNYPHDLDRLRRENEQLRKQLGDEREQAKQLSANERGFFELKLKERDNEFLEMEKQNAVTKRKYQKLSEEMQDMQRMLDENKVRNRELEKIQARFDAEMNALKARHESEREGRERAERERDAAKYEIFTIRSDLETQKLESSYHSEKVERLEKDLKVNFLLNCF